MKPSSNLNLKSVCSLIDERATGNDSHHWAICADGRRISYLELKALSDQLGTQLFQRDVARSMVAVRMHPSIELIITILGIMKAGNAYVPIPLDIPDKRVSDIYRQDEIVFEVLADDIKTKDCNNVCSFHYSDLISEPQRDSSQLPVISPSCAAYVIYTSGSTGRPKGVVVEHSNILCFLRGIEKCFTENPPLSGTMMCPYGFDVSVWEIFSILIRGGELHILNKEYIYSPNLFARYLQEKEIHSCYIPPGLLQETIDYICKYNIKMELSRVLVGVEPIQQQALQRLKEALPNTVIVNGYGPTETTVCATAHVFNGIVDESQVVPIGKPLKGYDVILENESNVDTGIGELLIGGGGVAREYLGDIDSTKRNFIDTKEGRFYRTGDRVRLLSNGEYEFIGRTDEQVKINGHRIELGEIATTIDRYPGVKRAIAIKVDVENSSFIAAFIEADIMASKPLLREYLSSRFPQYMRPAYLKVLSKFPTTTRGKIDKIALRNIVLNPVPTAVDNGQNDLDREIIKIWSTELGCSTSHGDNFFLLGGDSLAAVRIAAFCEEKFKKNVAIDSVFRYPVLEDYINYVSDLVENKVYEQNLINRVQGQLRSN